MAVSTMPGHSMLKMILFFSKRGASSYINIAHSSFVSL